MPDPKCTLIQQPGHGAIYLDMHAQLCLQAFHQPEESSNDFQAVSGFKTHLIDLEVLHTSDTAVIDVMATITRRYNG